MADTNKKIKVMTISDHPLALSGVGIQMKYIIEALLKSGKFEVISLAGAIKHQDYRPLVTEEYGESWKLIPADGFGTQEQIRSLVRLEVPDILIFFSDPRFYGHLFEIAHEIRPLLPMVYYCIWDHARTLYPEPGQIDDYMVPTYNKPLWESCDVLVPISKITEICLKGVCPQVETHRIPHSVNTNAFKKLPLEEVEHFKINNIPRYKENPNMKIYMYNSRNARRKQPGTLIWWFKNFLDIVGDENACLLMHTDIRDQMGQDLQAIIHERKLDKQQVLFSTQKISQPELALLYNSAHASVGISDAEGWGLFCLESMACGTPSIVTQTGGLQEQVQDDEGNMYGIPIKPASRSVIGSLDIPYIYEDRLNQQDFLDAMVRMHNMPADEYKAMSERCIKRANTEYNFENFGKRWVDLMIHINEKYGSWSTRKNYNRIFLKEF